MYRGQYRDPNTAGELYADLVKQAIQQMEEEGRGVCLTTCGCLVEFNSRLCDLDRCLLSLVRAL